MKNKISLAPSIFDRLIDEEPRKLKDNKPQQAISIAKFRQAVLRDILYLLNTTSLHSEELEILLPENVRSSTLNYGIPALSGVNLSDVDWVKIENSITKALIDFEPRLDAESLKVMVLIENEIQIQHNQLLIEIKGMLKLNPYPKEFWLKTTIDVETGLFSLIDGSINE